MPIRLPLRRPTSNLPRNTILIQIRFVTVCSSNMWLIWQLLMRPHATSVLTRSSSSVEHVKACLHNTSEAPTALLSSSFCDAQGMFELCLAEDFLAMSIVLINYTTCPVIDFCHLGLWDGEFHVLRQCIQLQRHLAPPVTRIWNARI